MPVNGDTTSGVDKNSAGTKTGVGELLRAERLARDLSVEDVARQLRLAVRQVTALEEDDYGKFPGETFVRGFIRNYAKLLQMDAAPLLQKLGQSLPPTGPQSITYQSEGVPFPSKQKHGSRNVIIAGVTVLALSLLVYEIYRANEANIGKRSSVISEIRVEAEQATEPPQLQSSDAIIDSEAGEVSSAEGATAAEQEDVVQAPAPAPAPAPVPVPAPVRAPAPAPAPARVPARAPAPAEPANVVPSESASQRVNTDTAAVGANGGANGIRLVFAGDSWTEVRDGRGKLLLSRINRRGTEHVLHGTPPFFLTIGNATEVKLVYNNKPVDLAPYTSTYGGTARLSLD